MGVHGFAKGYFDWRSKIQASSRVSSQFYQFVFLSPQNSQILSDLSNLDANSIINFQYHNRIPKGDPGANFT